MKKAASQIITKATPAVGSLDAILQRSDVQFVSKVLLEPIEDVREFLTTTLDAANAILVADGTSGELPQLASMTEVAERIAGAKKDIALVTSMLAAISSSHTRRSKA